MSEQIATTQELMQPFDTSAERWYRQAQNLQGMEKVQILIELSLKASAKGNKDLSQKLTDVYFEHCRLIDECWQMGEILMVAENAKYQKQVEIAALELELQKLRKMNNELLNHIEI